MTPERESERERERERERQRKNESKTEGKKEQIEELTKNKYKERERERQRDIRVLPVVLNSLFPKWPTSREKELSRSFRGTVAVHDSDNKLT